MSTAPMPPPPKSSPATASATPVATPTPFTTGPDPVANENAIYAALKSKNYDGFAALLAADSIEVEPTGVYDKAGSVKTVSMFDFSKAQLSEFKSVPFDKDAALVTYLVKLPGAPAERHSTIWAERDGKWLAVFHHGTPIPRGTPATAPSPKVRRLRLLRQSSDRRKAQASLQVRRAVPPRSQQSTLSRNCWIRDLSGGPPS